MFLKIPVLVWVGLLVGIVVVAAELLFSIPSVVTFAVLFVIFWIFLYSTEYKLPFGNFLAVSALLWLGYAIIFFLFRSTVFLFHSF